MNAFRHNLNAIVYVACALFLALDCRACADTPAPTDANAAAEGAVKSGSDALKNEHHFPWYDSKSDALRPVEFGRPDGDGANRSTKAAKPRKGSHEDNTNGDASGNDSTDNGSSQPDDSSQSSFSMPSISAPWLIWVAWIVIGAVLVALAVLLIRAFLNREARESKTSTSQSAEIEDDGDRLDALPIPAARPKGGLLDEARRCYEAGDYNTAIIYLYGYQLLRLDQNQWLRLAKGKTNRQYLRELSGRGELQGVLGRTIVPFEDVYFGSHSLDRDRFEACWSEVERFNRLVERSPT